LLLIAVFEAKAGAKISHLFETTKSFGNFFQKTFSKNLYCLSPFLEAKAGAKIRHFFETTKSFGDFFQKTSKNLCFALPARVYLSDCGCKGSALFLFSKHFYNYFQKLFRFFNNIRVYLYLYI